MKTVVDTTVFTDVLLKADAQRTTEELAIKNASETLLPVYAIKEFKSGPLHYFAWYHNKVVEASSWPEAISVIRNNIGRRKNLPATALQAVGDFLGALGKNCRMILGSAIPA